MPRTNILPPPRNSVVQNSHKLISVALDRWFAPLVDYWVCVLHFRTVIAPMMNSSSLYTNFWGDIDQSVSASRKQSSCSLAEQGCLSSVMRWSATGKLCLTVICHSIRHVNDLLSAETWQFLSESAVVFGAVLLHVLTLSVTQPSTPMDRIG